MKLFLASALAAVFVVNLIGCTTPEEARRLDAERAREDAHRDAERRREDARWEAERRQRDQERDAQDYQDFLVRFARELGKVPAELNSVQRAEARRQFQEGRH